MPFPADRRPARWLAPLLALLVGVAAVTTYDAALAGYRYAYSGDSASYLEMAAGLKTSGEPLVVPWDIRPADRERILQPLFPPGYALLINALAPLAGSAKAAALWPPRIAAMLLPLALLLAFRRLVPDAALLGLGLYALASPGVLYWHYIAYSDVPCLFLTVASLGLLLRAESGGRVLLFGAGLVAALAYTLRNAALALLVASFAALMLCAIVRPGFWRALPAWLLGALLPVAALKLYDLREFGRLEPYWMPPSSRAWPDNLADWVGSQLVDLHLRADDAAPLTPALALAVLLPLTSLALTLWWKGRRHTPAHRALTLLGLYVGAGVAMLIASRSTFEWGDFIDTRHALQYSFAIALGAMLLVREFAPARVQRVLAVLAVPALAAVVYFAVDTAVAERGEVESWQAIASDVATLERLKALPADAFLASNDAVLLRVETARAVRQLDVGGDDASFAGSLADLARAAAPRAASFVLICSEWTSRFGGCAASPVASGPRCERLRHAPPYLALCAAPVALSRGPA
jgi:hypothetical protein